MTSEVIQIDLSIYLSSLNGVDTASRYASACRELGHEVVICAEPQIAERVAGVVSQLPLEVQALPPVAAGWYQAPYDLIRNYASSLQMGDNPANIQTSLPSSRSKSAIVRALRGLRGKPSSPTINRFLRRRFGHALPRQFPSRRVLAISFPLVPLRLCQRDLIVDTVVDSWDHPVRRTAGYRTRIAIAWNDDLGRDWQTYQGADRVLIGPPVKLEYALGNPTQATNQKRTMLYPVATSSHYPTWFEEELAIIGAIARAARRAGWDVLVKPKPENRLEEFEPILGKFANLSLGAFLGSFGALDYHLSPDYNDKRLIELSQATLVVNGLTTFGLDAACAGVPLIQLDLRSCESLRVLRGVAANHHLAAHLYRLTSPALIEPRSLVELETLLVARLASREPGPGVAAANLREWVARGRNVDVTDVVSTLMGDPLVGRLPVVPRDVGLSRGIQVQAECDENS